jgi:hypothetical protein
MTFGKPFEPGREKTGGRKLGVRNKLSERFLSSTMSGNGADRIA